MTQSQRENLITAVAIGSCLIALFFIMGMFAGIDEALKEQERRGHLSVYCQQAGAIETLCAELRGRE